MPLRMSVRPVASQTRTPLGNGIIARPAPAVPPRPPPDRERPRSAPVRHPAARSRSAPDGAGTASATDSGAAGAIATAAKPGMAGAARGSAPDLGASCLRQVKSWLVLTPCRRATPCTVCARRQRLGHQPALVLLCPAPARPLVEDLDLRHRSRSKDQSNDPSLDQSERRSSGSARARRPPPDGYLRRGVHPRPRQQSRKVILRRRLQSLNPFKDQSERQSSGSTLLPEGGPHRMDTQGGVGIAEPGCHGTGARQQAMPGKGG